jgi:DNA-directed RNA polymerase subunit RPC12/RpoP
MPITRTKLFLVGAYAVSAALVYLLYDGPASDRRFALGLWLVVGAALLVLLGTARVVRCPSCGADTGAFHTRLRVAARRTVTCPRCGTRTDRFDG